MAMKLYLDNPEIVKEFEAVKASLPGADQPWLNDLRKNAMSRFAAVGIPGPKVEEWRYTKLGFLANENYGLASSSASAAEIKALFDKAYIKDIAGPVVVFVNGMYHSALSSGVKQQGVKFTIFSENTAAFQGTLQLSEGSTSFNNLNQALFTDGYSLDIGAGILLDQPLQIIHLTTSGTDMTSVRTRSHVTAGAGAKAQIVESYIGAKGERYWGHTVSNIHMAENAEVSLHQFQLQGPQAIHMTELHTAISDGAKFSHISLQLGAEISRTELINDFTGENATAELRGAYLARHKQSHDIFTRINHNRPHCQSNQLFRGVLDEAGTSAFQGKVIVAQDAQKTNADQSNKNLLLSRKAAANIKPELLIYADDVKCSHGATVGELDANQLFYLRSRGLDAVAAKSLLVEAFVAEVFDELSDDILKQKFKEKVGSWLSGEMTE